MQLLLTVVPGAAPESVLTDRTMDPGTLGVDASTPVQGQPHRCGPQNGARPKPTLITQIGLVGALTDHYSSPGCLSDYRHQFERTVRQDGEDPSKFAVALETLAVKAFGDMGPNARTSLIHDRFIAVTVTCGGTSIMCRLMLPFEISSTDVECGRAMPTPITGELLTEQVIVAINGPSVELTDLEAMLKRLLQDVLAQAPPPCSAPTDIEAMLKRLLPGMLTQAPQPRPATSRRDWSTVFCFSCGQYGHGVGRCPKLDVTFPFMLPGWSTEMIGDYYAMISPRLAAERIRAGNGN